MATLKQQLQQDQLQALKNQDKDTLSTLRFLQSEIQNQEIANGRQEMDDPALAQFIAKQIKKLQEDLDIFQKAQRTDLVTKTENEITLLKKYLPEALDDTQLKEKITEIITKNPQFNQPGPLIGLCLRTLGSQADPQKVARLVNEQFAPK